MITFHQMTPDEIAAEKAAEAATTINPISVAKSLIDDAEHAGNSDRVLLLQEARSWIELSKEVQQ